MEQTALNRLIAARHLIEASGQATTDVSSALIIAQKILVGHDAAELVFIALLSQLKLVPKGKDNQPIKDPPFMVMAKTILDHAAKQPHWEERGQEKLLEDLNEARKIFKHSGVLVDPYSNAHLFDQTVRVLHELCVLLLGQSLSSIDQTAAIKSAKIRDRFVSAREAIGLGNYKLALEYIARGLSIAFWEMEAPTSIAAGDPSSEAALMLSGRGVDPASFLTMQQLLPTVYHDEWELSWKLRKYGHEANWTEANALFCLETAISTTIRLQSAPTRPMPFDFYDIYEDTVKITVDRPEAILQTFGFGFAEPLTQEDVDVFRAGDIVSGVASGRLKRGVRIVPESEIDFEFAEWVLVESPKTTRLDFSKTPPFLNALWFRKEQVELSYRVDQSKEALRRRLSQLTEPESQPPTTST